MNIRKNNLTFLNFETTKYFKKLFICIQIDIYDVKTKKDIFRKSAYVTG